MKVLLAAFACAPGRGSEPNVGWNVALQVASRHEAWVLTDAANEPLITPALARNASTRPRFVFVSVPQPLYGVRGTAGFHYLYYLAWQLRAARIARSLHEKIGFDLVHHVTYVNSWLPTWLGGLGIPFIWNAGGRDTTPWSFFPSLSWRSRIGELIRNIAMATLGRLTSQAVARRARLILTASDVAKWPPGLPVVRFPIGGLDEVDMEALVTIPPRAARPFRILSVGRLLGLKGFHLALEAFARLRQAQPESEYWIVGDGPERANLEQQAQQLGCAEAVRFWGWLPRPDVWRCLAEVDVLVHPSLHEQFGYVLLEAMAAGRPVIGLDVGGSAILVEAGGFKVSVRSPQQVVADLHGVLLRLAYDPTLRAEMGTRGRQYAKDQFSWDTLGERLTAYYRQILHRLDEPNPVFEPKSSMRGI